MKKLLSGLSKHYITSMQGWHWQVSANIGLNHGLNRFKLVRQKQVSAIVLCLHHHVHWLILSFVIVCFVERLLLTNIIPK